MIGPVHSIASTLGAATLDGARVAGKIASPEVNGAGFGDVLAAVSGNAVQSVQNAEATSIAALKGQTSVLEVVEAVKSAEQALQTAIAIRDKVVSAYQEISRMAI